MVAIEGAALAYAIEATDLYDAILQTVAERYATVCGMDLGGTDSFTADERMRVGIVATEVWKRVLPDFQGSALVRPTGARSSTGSSPSHDVADRASDAGVPPPPDFTVRSGGAISVSKSRLSDRRRY